MKESRFELLCQKHLDDEATEAERAELSGAIARDPDARRRFDEYVALEGLLFTVGNTDRPSEQTSVAAPSLDLIEHSREALPSEEEMAMSGAWMSSVAGALLLAVIVWWGLPDSPPRDRSAPIDLQAELPRPQLEVAALSPGLHAIVQETDDASIQFIWIGSAPAARAAAATTRTKPVDPDPTPRKDTDE